MPRVAATLLAAVLAALSALGAAPTRKPSIAAEVPAETAEVAVVFDDLAAADDARFARSRAVSASRLLGRAGLPAPVFPQSALAAALREPCRVAHLLHLSRFDRSDRAALDSFVARGGRVVVHGVEAPALAAWFGVTPPPKERTPPPGGGAWTAFRFAEPRPLNAPARIESRAAAVLSLRPAAPDVRAIAHWEDGAGRSGPAAAFRGPKGFWIVRTLYEDASARDRARLLSALTCTMHAPLWRTSEKALEAAAWAVAGAKDAAGAEAALVRLAPEGRREIVRSLFHGVRKVDAARAALCSRGLYGAAQSNVWELASAVRLARCAALPLEPARAGRPLAAWIPGGRLPPACPSWRVAAAQLASAGVTDVYLYAGSLAGAVGPIPGVPRAAGAPADPFPEAVAACRAFGVRVHAWLPALQFENAPDDRFAGFAKAGRLLHDPSGRALGWLDPAVAANARDIARAAVALAKTEGVVGVQLDFVRYPGPATREKRSAAAVTELVARVRRELRAAAPACELSAAVYGSYPACRDNVGQDWRDWLARGIVDRAVPMNYFGSLESLRAFMARQREGRDRLVCGLGPCARESFLEPDELLEQLREAYREGYAGAALFSFDAHFVEDLLPALRIAR